MKRGGDAKSPSPELFSGLYDGVVPPLLAGLPSGKKQVITHLSADTAIL